MFIPDKESNGGLQIGEGACNLSSFEDYEYVVWNRRWNSLSEET